MNKLFAVIKREYLVRVRTKFFVIMTILGPVLLVVFTIVPGLLFSMKAGGDTRIAIVDQTEGMRLYDPIRRSLLKQDRDETNNNAQGIASSVGENPKDRMEKAGKSLKGSFYVEQVDPNGRSLDDVRHELNARIGKGELDGYLVIPPDILANSDSKTSYYGRNVGDVITRGQIEDRLNSAVRRQRLIQGGVKDKDVDALSKSVNVATFPVNEKGQEGAEDSGAGFAMVFIIAFLIYMTVLLYGQVVLGAIVEEKETRIAEILFSSARPFPNNVWEVDRRFANGAHAVGDLGAGLCGSRGLCFAGADCTRQRRQPSALAAAVFCLLLSFLWLGLFHLCDRLRARRLDGYDDSRGRPDGDAGGLHVNGRLVHGFPGHPRAQLLLRVLGFDGSVFLTHHDDGANRLAATAVLADSTVARDRAGDRCALALVGLANLSHRHVDVREEGHDT